MRQCVEEAPSPYLMEPGLGRDNNGREDSASMKVEDVSWKSCYHTKEGELPKME